MYESGYVPCYFTGKLPGNPGKVFWWRESEITCPPIQKASTSFFIIADTRFLLKEILSYIEFNWEINDDEKQNQVLICSTLCYVTGKHPWNRGKFSGGVNASQPFKTLYQFLYHNKLRAFSKRVLYQSLLINLVVTRIHVINHDT